MVMLILIDFSRIHHLIKYLFRHFLLLFESHVNFEFCFYFYRILFDVILRFFD